MCVSSMILSKLTCLDKWSVSHGTFNCVPMEKFPKIPLHVTWSIRLGKQHRNNENIAHVLLLIMHMFNCVDGTFCMDDGNFSKWKCHRNIKIFIEGLY